MYASKILLYSMFTALLLIASTLPYMSYSANNPENYYLKYTILMNLSGTDSAGNSIAFAATALFTLNILLYDDRVRVVSRIEDFEMSASSGTYTTSMNIGSGIPGMSTTYTREYGIEEFYSSSFEGLPLSSMQTVSGLNFNLYYNISYNGLGDYNGYPVYKYRVSIDYSSYDYKLTGSGELYVYVGIPLPLYFNINIVMSGKGSGTANMKLELKEANLPSRNEGLVEDLGKAYAIVGGLPGAKIKIEGSKGSTILKVSNTGTETGYVLILEKPSLKTAHIYVDQRTTNKYWMVVVKPGETKTIPLGFKLEKEVSATTQEVAPRLNWALIAILAVIALAIGGLVWIIHRILSKTKKALTVQTPPAEPQPQEETPGETPQVV